MNRGAVVGFLVLAALVGGTASLQDQHLTALGERLLAIQREIDTHSTYRPLAPIQSAQARLAFLELDDYAGWDVPGNYDGGYGSGYDYAVAQQTSWDFDVPVDQGVYGTPATLYQQDSWNYDLLADQEMYGPPAPLFQQDSWNFDTPVDTYITPAWQSGEFDVSQWGTLDAAWQSGEYDIDYSYYDPYEYPLNVAPAWQSSEFDVSQWGMQEVGDPDGYGIVATPNGEPYPTSPYSWGDPDDYGVVVTPNGQSYPTIDLSGGANERAVSGSAREDLYTPITYEVISYEPTVYEMISYQPNTYVIGAATYEPAWYERAFPGWGTAAIALLPSQYRPDYGVGYSPYLSVQPTYYGSAGSVPPPRVRPTCTISLSDSTIEYGGNTVLSWQSQGAAGASLNGIGTVPLSGTRRLENQTVSRTYGITVTGPGGTGACYAALSVSTQQNPSCQISVNPTKIKKGETANLAWISTNATEAALAGFGTVPVQSGRVVSPSADTTFILAVKNAANRAATCSVKIDVQ